MPTIKLNPLITDIRNRMGNTCNAPLLSSHLT